MIVQKLAQAIRGQDWFQVVIEVLIVIVGIFLGLQVQEAYEEHGEREQERSFLDRMHTEVIETLGYQDQLNSTYIFLENQKNTDVRLRELIGFLSGANSIDSMNNKHCSAVVTSHILFDTTLGLPTVTELLSSGQISLIQNEDVKMSISEYLRAIETITLLVQHMESVSLVMARKYPDIIKFDLTNQGVELNQRADHQCDFNAMKQSNAFKNDIADNASKFYGYLAAYSRKQEKLENIHTILDRELGIGHEDDNT